MCHLFTVNVGMMGASVQFNQWMAELMTFDVFGERYYFEKWIGTLPTELTPGFSAANYS